jgi:hypothetical protein
MTKSKSELPGVIVLILILIGLYLLYLLVLFLIKLFVYAGFNYFFFTDNLLKIRSFNPIIVWAVLGLFLGSIVGVIIAIKKYKLSQKLILYPIGVASLFIIIMVLINKPSQYATSLNLAGKGYNEPVDTVTVVTRYYYKAISDVRVRTGPSAKDRIAFVLKRKDQIEIIQRGFFDFKNVEWVKINYNGMVGYVGLRFLKYSHSASQ